MTWPHWLAHSWGPWSEPAIVIPWMFGVERWESYRVCRTCGLAQTRRIS